MAVLIEAAAIENAKSILIYLPIEKSLKFTRKLGTNLYGLFIWRIYIGTSDKFKRQNLQEKCVEEDTIEYAALAALRTICEEKKQKIIVAMTWNDSVNVDIVELFGVNLYSNVSLQSLTCAPWMYLHILA